MKQIYVVAIIALMTMYCNVFAQNNFDEEYPSQDPSGEYIPNQVYWQVKAGTEVPVFDADDEVPQEKLNQITGLAAIVANFQVNQIEKSFKHWQKEDELGRTYTVHFDDNEDGVNLLKSLNGLTVSKLTEYIPQIKLFLTPNDPYYLGEDEISGTDDDLQFYLDNINAPTAWDIETCSDPVVIAIVDDAMLTTHEDLIDNLWTNPNEIPGDGIDNDGNGYIDDVNGWDVADNDNNPNPPAGIVGNPSFSHGTHVAGIAAAKTNNEIGIASMGYNCLIMPVKTTKNGTSNSAILDNPYGGVLYAIQSGADVINMSWGGTDYSFIHELVIQQAIEAGIVCVAAAGNEGTFEAAYPARYVGVIGVGATQGENSDEIAPFSNYGIGVDVMAPGVGIHSAIATNTNDYDAWDGTSMAAPLVAGLAGLYLCKHGGNPNTNSLTVELCIQENALNIDGENLDIAPNLLPGLLQADEVLGCKPEDFINLCLPGNCNLIRNGDFETPYIESTLEYSYANPFNEYQVCGWYATWESPHLFSQTVSDENHLRMWASSSGSWSEGIVSIEALSIVPEMEYTLSFDYAAVNAEVTIHFSLVDTNSPIFGGDEFSILSLFIEDEDLIETNFYLWGDELSNPDSFTTENGVNFTAPSDNSHLLIYVTSEEGITYGNPGILLDNIKISPRLEVDAWVDDNPICLGNETELHVVTIGGETVEWEPADFLSDPTSFNPIANPPEETLYTVTVTNEEGCTVSTTVLVEVDDCPPKCDDELTVETFCDDHGVTLQAFLNGVPVDLSSTYPVYTLVWSDGSGGNTVTLPWGTDYTVTLGVAYDINHPEIFQCEYNEQGFAEGDLNLDIQVTSNVDVVCPNNSCAQLEVIGVPPGFGINWSPITSLDDSESPTPIACPSEYTEYTVTVEIPNSLCNISQTIAIDVEECECEDIDIVVIEECEGFETITKVYIDGVALNPAILPWIDIDWYLISTNTWVYDENCVNFPVGTEYVAIITWGEDCERQISYEQVKHPHCINCGFTVVENCDEKGIQLTMFDVYGNPVVPGATANYNVSLIWNDLTNLVSYNYNNVTLPLGTNYEAILEITTLDGVVICSNHLDGIVQGCCDELVFDGVDITYFEGEDLQLTWHAEGAVSYTVDVVHNYVNCEPETCQFNVVSGGTSTSLSLTDEGCFFTCQEYNITITAFCADGTTAELIVPEYFTTPPFGECQACDDGGGNGGDDNGTGGKGGKRMLAPMATHLNIYPNPAQNHFSLQFDSMIEEAHIQVFDLSGKQLKNQQVRNASTTLVDMSQLEAAVYLVKISIEAQEPIFRKIAIVK